MAKIDYGNSLSTAGQFPLDGKRQFKTLDDMKNNISTNAFRYYEDMEVRCISNHNKYIWRERIDVNEQGVLENDFIYPNGALADEINYSGRSFNFFEVKLSGTNQDNKTKLLTIDFLEIPESTTSENLESAILNSLTDYFNNLSEPLNVLEDENLYIEVLEIITIQPE